MKRLIFCFDGTWNALGADNPTNVVLTAASIVRETSNRVTQIIHYDEGVGTGRLERMSGGILGAGLFYNIREAYRFLIFNYDPGDEIFVFGFSRGAFSARSFIGLVRHVGPLHRLHAGRIDEAMKLYQQRTKGISGSGGRMRAFRAAYSDKVCIGSDDDAYRCQNVSGYNSGDAPVLTIKFLGVWDTVKALGWPDIMPVSARLNRKHSFHDAGLSDFIESARHAVAVDERRSLFPVERMSGLKELNEQKGADWREPSAPYQERWFPGTHGSVGGGGDIRGLSDAALAWVLDGAKKAGLVLDTARGTRIHGFLPDARVSLVNEQNPKWSFTQIFKGDRIGPDHMWQLAPSATRRWYVKNPDGSKYRPITLSKVSNALDSLGGEQFEPKYTLIRTTHKVKPRDELRKLAKEYYGDPNLSHVIFDANRDLLDNEHEIFAGWVLRIPELDSNGGAGEQPCEVV
jgi:uncharacterized protein (DUF2235 family)